MDSKKSKVFKNVITESIIDDIEEDNITNYINKLKDKIIIQSYPVKVKIIITSDFNTPLAFDIIESHYSHPVEVIQSNNNVDEFDNKLKDKFEAWIDEF